MRAEAAPATPEEVALLRKAGLRLTPKRLAIAREVLEHVFEDFRQVG